MIRVTVELVPGGVESRRRLLGTMHIVNTGEGTETRGNYRATRYGKTGRKGATGEIHGHPRLADSMWELVRKALEATKIRRGSKTPS
jgi:hypothetical protein